jgi:hypothetical protein
LRSTSYEREKSDFLTAAVELINIILKPTLASRELTRDNYFPAAAPPLDFGHAAYSCGARRCL